MTPDAQPTQAPDDLREAMEGLLADEECWVTRSALPCANLIGGTFGNGVEWIEEMCCLPCRLRALLDRFPAPSEPTPMPSISHEHAQRILSRPKPSPVRMPSEPEATVVEEWGMRDGERRSEVAEFDDDTTPAPSDLAGLLAEHNLSSGGRNLGQYRTEWTCACGVTFVTDGHKGEGAKCGYDAHLAAVIAREWLPERERVARAEALAEVERRLRGFAMERFYAHGPHDARGAALWDAAAYIAEDMADTRAALEGGEADVR